MILFDGPTLHILLIIVQNTGLLICCDVLLTYLELGGSVQHDILGTALNVFHPTRQPTHLQQTHPQSYASQLTYNKHAINHTPTNSPTTNIYHKQKHS